MEHGHKRIVRIAKIGSALNLRSCKYRRTFTSYLQKVIFRKAILSQHDDSAIYECETSQRSNRSLKDHLESWEDVVCTDQEQFEGGKREHS